MQKTLKKELSFSLDTLERYRAKYGRSASLDANGTATVAERTETVPEATAAPPVKTTITVPSLFTKTSSPPKMTKLQELQQKKEAYMRAREHEREMEQLQRAERIASVKAVASSSSSTQASSTEPTATSTTPASGNAGKSNSPISSSSSTTTTGNAAAQASKCTGGYVNWTSKHGALSALSWCAISDLMYFCDKYEFKTLSTRDLRTHQEIVSEVRALLAGKAPFDQRTRFPGNIYDPENLWVCIGRCASVEYHLQRIICAFRKPLNQLTPDKQRAVRQNFHLAVSELRLDISARISEVRLYDRLVFEREFRLEWQDEA